MKRLITGTLAVSLLLPTGARAQAPQADAPPPVSNPAVGRVVDTQPSELRVKVEAISFRALDETGYDRFGSDEVIVLIRDATGKILTTSKEFGGVDRGETRTFAPNQRCRHCRSVCIHG